MNKALLALALSAAAITAGHAQIIISEVDPAGSGTSTYKADWFELTNTGSSAVSITGWKMDDNHASFSAAVALSLQSGATSIAAGQTVIFLETTSAALSTIVPSFETAWFGTNVPANLTFGGYGGSSVGLSQSGDAVNIYNASGTVVTGVTFGASPSTGGTFDNTAGLTGTISMASVSGTDGAFASKTGGEIGSPGVDTAVAVPEPSTYAMMIVGGLLALFGIQMRRRMGADVRR